MRISDILQSKGSSVVTIGPAASVTELIAALGRHRIGALVVTEHDTTVGIVSERDVVRRLAEVGASVLEQSVSDLMTAEPLTCTPDDSLDDIAALMTERRFRHLPVLTGGKLVGIVTIGDVVAARLRELETTRAQLESYITQG
jgi:CBS domain-containing protein